MFSTEMALAQNKMMCSEITNNFCDQLWSRENNGNLVLGDRHFYFGKDEDTNVSYSTLLTIRKRYENIDQLPGILKDNEKYRSLLKEQVDHLSTERLSDKWDEKLQLIEMGIRFTQNAILQEEFFRQFPDLKNKKENEYTLEDKKKLTKMFYEFSSDFIDSNLKGSPEWSRVEKIFSKMKERVTTVLEGFNLSENLKDRLIKKIKSVELSFPYLDPKLLGVDSKCFQGESNAFYVLEQNKITICSGLLYTLKSEGTLSMIFAHELAHSIDLRTLRSEYFLKDSIMKALVDNVNEGELKSCKKWNTLFKEIDIQKESFQHDPVRISKLDQLSECLIDKSQLQPIDKSNIEKVAEHYAINERDNLSRRHKFSFLLSPKIERGGKEILNEVYLRPDLASKNFLFDVKEDSAASLSLEHLFHVHLLCDGSNDAPLNFDFLSFDEQERRFEQAIIKSSETKKFIYMKLFSLMGNESSGLTQFGLAKISGENFADWIASKAIALEIKDKSAEKQFEIVSEMGAAFCDAPEQKLEERFMLLEKKFSLEPHANNKRRRMSLFNKEIADIVGCELDQEVISGFGSCKL